MGTIKLQLPIVIVTGDADPAELAEKIVRQNPEHFGAVDIGGVYTRADTETEEDRTRELRQTVTWLEKGRALDGRTITGLLILSIAGWSLAIARGIWGF